jgi:hypothetical protein
MNNDSRMAFPKKQKTNNRIVSSQEPYAHLVCSPQKQKMNNRIISSQESYAHLACSRLTSPRHLRQGPRPEVAQHHLGFSHSTIAFSLCSSYSGHMTMLDTLSIIEFHSVLCLGYTPQVGGVRVHEGALSPTAPVKESGSEERGTEQHCSRSSSSRNVV